MTANASPPAQDKANNVSFDMLRDHLDDIPQYTLPPGYRSRTYRPGDGPNWTVLQRAAEPFFPIPDDFFDQQFGEHLDALPDRMFFVETETGEIAGTITAWWERDRDNPDERGRIHWVAVHPAHQRRAISKPMMTVAMHRLAQSHRRARLGTSSGRPWAVKVYLDFGFYPDPDELSNPKISAAWRHVQATIRHPALEKYLGQ